MNLHDLQPPLPTELAPGVRIRILNRLPGLDAVFWDRTGTIRNQHLGLYWNVDLDPTNRNNWNHTIVSRHEVEIIR